MVIQGLQASFACGFFGFTVLSTVAKEREFCIVGFYGPAPKVACTFSAHILLAITQSQGRLEMYFSYIHERKK